MPSDKSNFLCHKNKHLNNIRLYPCYHKTNSPYN